MAHMQPQQSSMDFCKLNRNLGKSACQSLIDSGIRSVDMIGSLSSGIQNMVVSILFSSFFSL